MPHEISAWRTEHVYFNRLLGLLQREVDVFHSGERPNYELMLDIVSYLREFSDRFHHPREEVAFALLAARSPDMAPALARLGQEHRVIAQAGEALRSLLEATLGGAVIPRAEIEVAAATYVVYYVNHIAKEEEDVLPGAAQLLKPQDWEAVRTAVPARNGSLGAEQAEERYRALRRQIAAES